MGYGDAIFLFLAALILLGGSFGLVYYINHAGDKEKNLTQELCESNGGRWKECGNKCQIMNAGKEGVFCPQVCEPICECGTIAGLGCPADYTCKMPSGIADAGGYCE